MGEYPTDWTAAAVTTLKTLHGNGDSFASIAAQINHQHGTKFTRNAVCGKAHRMGMVWEGPARPKLTKPKPEPRRATRKAAPNVQPYFESPEDPGMVKLLDLRVCHCRWPVGDPTSEDFRFCGRPMVRGAYCAGHAARAYSDAPLKKLRAA